MSMNANLLPTVALMSCWYRSVLLEYMFTLNIGWCETLLNLKFHPIFLVFSGIKGPVQVKAEQFVAVRLWDTV